MAAVITSVVPVPDSFTNATATITGTGFGASTGTLLIVFPDYGQSFAWGSASWNATTITLNYPSDIEFVDQGITFPTNVYWVVIPLGDDVGGRSAAALVTPDPSPITTFANDTLIVAGPTATADNGGPVTPPPTYPLRTALGRTNGYAGPGYDVKWYVYVPQNQAYETGLDGFDQTDFSIVGTSVQTNLEHLGISIPTLF